MNAEHLLENEKRSNLLDILGGKPLRSKGIENEAASTAVSLCTDNEMKHSLSSSVGKSSGSSMRGESWDRIGF